MRKALFRFFQRPGETLGLFAFGRWIRWVYRWIVSPRRLLTLFFWLLIGGFAFLFVLDHGYLNAIISHPWRPGLDTKDWLVAGGTTMAASGWMISSMVTIRNSVKQHTINTLLQTRLSAAYMEQAKHISKFLTTQGYSPKSPAPLSLIKDVTKPENRIAVDYVLNFLEFMAVGIRHEDLHETVLKDSMRGIAVNFSKTVQLYIDDVRGDAGGKVEHPRVYEHLLWLRKRWDD